MSHSYPCRLKNSLRYPLNTAREVLVGSDGAQFEASCRTNPFGTYVSFSFLIYFIVLKRIFRRKKIYPRVNYRRFGRSLCNLLGTNFLKKIHEQCRIAFIHFKHRKLSNREQIRQLNFLCLQLIGRKSRASLI